MATILLIHGIPGSAATWQQVTRILEPQQEVFAPNLLGFGGTESYAGGDELLAPNQALHVLNLLDRREIEQVVVVGHDFGGPVAAHLAALAPERVTALALFATNAFSDTPVPFPLSMLNVPFMGMLAQRILFSRPSLAMMVRRGVGRPKPKIELRGHLGDRRQSAAISSIFAASLRRMRELYEPVEAALRSVAVPALVGWGEMDPFFDVTTGQRTASLIPGAVFRLYEGAGHFLPEERPQQLAEDVQALVARQES